MTCSTNCPQLRGEGQGHKCECSTIASQNAVGWPAIRLGLIYLRSYFKLFFDGAGHHGAKKYASRMVRHDMWRKARIQAIQTPFQ